MKRWMAVLAFCVAVILVGGGVPPTCWGDSLIRLTDTDTDPLSWAVAACNSDFPTALTASWTQTVATTNTTIGAILTGLPGAQGQAYLTTALGPGTTVADQIAAAIFTPPLITDIANLTSAPVTTLFTSLNLNPGTYYLVFTGLTSEFVYWLGDTQGVSVTTAAGFTVGPQQYAAAASYPPASSNFMTLGSGREGDYQIFNVDGTPVPLPPTFLLLGSSLLGLVGWRRFRKG
jgi:hypothetical protein